MSEGDERQHDSGEELSPKPTPQSLGHSGRVALTLLGDLEIQYYDRLPELVNLFLELMQMLAQDEMRLTWMSEESEPVGSLLAVLPPSFLLQCEAAIQDFTASATRAADPESWDKDVPPMSGADPEQLSALALRFIQSVSDIAKQLADAARTVKSHFPNEADSRNLELLLADGVSQRLEALSVRHRSRQMQRTAEEALQDAVEAIADAAGTAGEVSLASNFDLLATAQEKAANRWRVIALVGFLVLLAAGAAGVLDAELEGWALLRRSLVALPGLGFVLYGIHEASEHRKRETWASECSVLLRSIRAYSADMPEAERSELRRALGIRVFLMPGPKPERANGVIGLLQNSEQEHKGPAQQTAPAA